MYLTSGKNSVTQGIVDLISRADFSCFPRCANDKNITATCLSIILRRSVDFELCRVSDLAYVAGAEEGREGGKARNRVRSEPGQDVRGRQVQLGGYFECEAETGGGVRQCGVQPRS